MRDVIQRCLNKLEISTNLEEMLFISNERRININSSVQDNGLRHDAKIDIIHDVIYAS